MKTLCKILIITLLCSCHPQKREISEEKTDTSSGYSKDTMAVDTVDRKTFMDLINFTSTLGFTFDNSNGIRSIKKDAYIYYKSVDEINGSNCFNSIISIRSVSLIRSEPIIDRGVKYFPSIVIDELSFPTTAEAIDCYRLLTSDITKSNPSIDKSPTEYIIQANLIFHLKASAEIYGGILLELVSEIKTNFFQ